MRFTLLILLLFGSAAASQTNHSTDHKAIERALNNSIGKDCVTVSGGGYNVVNGNAVSRYSISVKVDRECLASALNETVVVINWKTPKTRENGDPLESIHLSHYVVQIGNGRYEVPADKTLYSAKLSTGIHDISVIAVDKFDLASLPSETVTKTIKQ